MKKIITISVLAVLIINVNTLFANNEKNKNNPENTGVVCVKGKVMDLENGESLAGVKITVENTKIKAYTDFDGNFTLENIKPGKYDIVIDYISYESIEIKGMDVGDENDFLSEVKLRSK